MEPTITRENLADRVFMTRAYKWINLGAVLSRRADPETVKALVRVHDGYTVRITSARRGEHLTITFSDGSMLCLTWNREARYWETTISAAPSAPEEA